MPEILYRDAALVAVAKPAGRLVVPGRGSAGDGREGECLRDEVARTLGTRVFVVHRLDRDTSGVLLFALDSDAHRALSVAFERRQIGKRYWALCRGTMLGTGEVDHALVAARGGRVRAAGAGERGKPSRTRWRALERFPDAGPDRQGLTAVEWRPLSGRLHQVRAHAQVAGHPLAVDPAYGGAERLRVRDLVRGAEAEEVVVARVTLHAAGVELRHPRSGERLEIEAPLAEDLKRALEMLRR